MVFWTAYGDWKKAELGCWVVEESSLGAGCSRGWSRRVPEPSTDGRIMTAPYEDREGWEMTAVPLAGSVYLENYETPEARAEK